MMGTLPETPLDDVMEDQQDNIASLEDELQWEAQFNRSQLALVAAARKARQQREAGLAKPMVIDEL